MNNFLFFRYDSVLVKTNIAIVMGYVLSDVIIIVLNYKIIGDAFTLFHHALSIYGYTNALVNILCLFLINLTGITLILGLNWAKIK